LDTLSKLHPAVVHFPVAFLSLFILFELINQFLNSRELKKYSLIILSLGIIGGIVSVLTGNQSYQFLTNNFHLTEHHLQKISDHELFASITIWYFVGILIIQFYFFIKKKNESRVRYLFVIFIILGSILLYYTASIGGELVYNFGIGTDVLN